LDVSVTPLPHCAGAFAGIKLANKRLPPVEEPLLHGPKSRVFGGIHLILIAN